MSPKTKNHTTLEDNQIQRSSKLATLAGLLAKGSYTIAECVEYMQEHGFYGEDSSPKSMRRYFEYDILTLAKAGYDIRKEQAVGCRYVYYRLASAPQRSLQTLVPDPGLVLSQKKDTRERTRIKNKSEELLADQINPALVYSVSEVAKILGVVPRQVRYYITRGQLPAKQVNRQHIIQGAILAGFISSPPPYVEAKLRTRLEKPTLELEKETTSALPSAVNPDLPPPRPNRQAIALAYIEEHGCITPTVYAKLTGAALATASKDLVELAEQGRLERIGRRPHCYYILASNSGNK